MADEWLRDIPQQFQNKEKIAVLIRAFARQMEEVEQVFSDVRDKTDLETADGKNLDLVGDIVNLSRKDAMDLDVISSGKEEMTDERYRQFLRFKILKNTSECTYWDLMDGISMMWNMERLTYMERLEYPATILFRGEFDMDESDEVEFYPELCIRPSGVGVILEKAYKTEILVPVKVEAALRLFMEFYPVMNLEPLLLDGTWLLDGTRLLGGYKSEALVDFYPTGIRSYAESAVNIKHQEKVCFQVNQKAEILNQVSTGFFDLLPVDEQYGSRIKAKTEVPVKAEYAATACNMLLLDGSWNLDGSRELNGGQIEL